MSRRRSRSQSPGRLSNTCNSSNPRDLERRIFVGNLPTSDMSKKDLEDLFSPYGKILGVSMFRGFGFVQFQHTEEAEAAKAAQKGRIYRNYKLDVNMAVERRHAKPQTQQSPPRSYGDGKYSRPRSRSPHVREDRDGREGRDSRDSRDSREPRDSREGRDPVRPAHSRDHDFRYRALEGRDKDSRGDPRPDPRGDSRPDPRADPRPDPRDPREPAFREEHDRVYRSGSAAEDYFRRKDEPFRDPYREPWNGRREPEAVEDRGRPEERRRNELYRQYYEEVQRRYDTDRPVDCSVIVVNKAQNREYAETVGRKVRDLGMVVDLIFLNTEVSLTQALEDVGRARTPFAIIITQQHQVHRSCTVNILFGTPQEHRNMPMQDAMMLVAHNYDSYKVENREKEREEIARKAAKMADDVLLREPDRESHPLSLLTTITLLSENRFVSPEELDSLIAYLKDKRGRLVRTAAEPLSAPVHVAAPTDVLPSAVGLAPSSHPALAAPQTSHLGLSAATTGPGNSSHHQQLQAKILSLFSSGSSASAGGLPSSAGAQPPSYSSLGPAPSAQSIPRPAMQVASAPASQAYSHAPGRMPVAPSGQRAPGSGAGINLNSPSVQKALDTLMQSGPALNHLVETGAHQQQHQQKQQQQQHPHPQQQHPHAQQQQQQQHHPQQQQQHHPQQQQQHHLQQQHHMQQQQQQQVRPTQTMGQAPAMSMYPRHY